MVEASDDMVIDNNRFGIRHTKQTEKSYSMRLLPSKDCLFFHPFLHYFYYSM